MGKRILLIGDSHVAGLATRFEALATAAGWTATTYHDVGKSTGWFARREVISSRVAAVAPSVVVVVLGTNDEGAEGNQPLYEQHIASVVRQAGGATVVWVGPPTIPRSAEDDAGAAARNRILARQPGLQAIDGRVLTADLLAFRTPDGVHFTMRGYRGWADRIFAQILPILVRPVASGMGSGLWIAGAAFAVTVVLLFGVPAWAKAVRRVGR